MHSSTDHSAPLVTVITPSYRQGRYIEETILSVKNQTYRNIEHIVLDSCSDDETDAVVQRHLGSYRLTYLREKDRGQGDAINKGLERASGDIVCWLNSDDFYFDRHVVGKVVELFAEHPRADVITGDGYYVDDAGAPVMPITLASDKCITYDYLKRGDYLLQPATFWRRNPVRIDTALTYAFDWKFFLDFFRQGKKFLYVRECLACYRLQQESKTFTDTARRKGEALQVLKAHDAPFTLLAWCRLIYYSYLCSEALHLPVLKRAARVANKMMWRASGMRIVSN